MHAGSAHQGHVGRCVDAALGDQQAVGRHASPQVERGIERGREGAQVAVVDPDQRRAGGERAVEFFRVVDFDQHVHAERAPEVAQAAQARIVEGGDDQQDGVGTDRARLVDLVLVDGEVLAQHRQRAGGARGDQEILMALEKVAIGEHRQAGRPAGFVTARDLRRAEVGADHALAGRGLLDLGDHRRAASGDLRAQGGLEAARRGQLGGAGVQFGEWNRGPARGDFLGLAGQDGGEDVAHAAPPARPRVVATNWCSFSRAAPLASTARAAPMPSAMLPTTSAA